MRTLTLIAAAIAWVSLAALSSRVYAGHFVLQSGAVVDGDVIAEDAQTVTVQTSTPIATITQTLTKSQIVTDSRAADELGAAQAHRKQTAAAAAANERQVESTRKAAWQKYGTQIVDLDQRIAKLRATQNADAAAVCYLRGEFDKEIALIDAEYEQQYVNQFGVQLIDAGKKDKLLAIASDQTAFYNKVSQLIAEGTAAGLEADSLRELENRLVGP